MSELVVHIVSNQFTVSGNKKDRGEAILIFLSGIQQIEKLNQTLRQNNKLKTKSVQVNCFMWYFFAFF
jgi:HrpA-like RNA helicase